MDQLKGRIAAIVEHENYSDAGEDFAALRRAVVRMSREDLISARDCACEVWCFLAALSQKKRMYRSQIASVARALAADEGWRDILEKRVASQAREELQFAFSDQRACESASLRLHMSERHACEAREHREHQSDWQVLEDRVCRQDFMTANEDFGILRRAVLESRPQDIERLSEKAGVVFAFLIGFADLKEKSTYRRQIAEVVRTLMNVPSWRFYFLQQTDLHESASRLHRDIREAFAIPRAGVHVERSPQPDMICEFPLDRTSPSSEHDDTIRSSCLPALSHESSKETQTECTAALALSVRPRHVQCDPIRKGKGKGKGRRGRVDNTNVDNAAADLREFAESADGQALIREVFECYQFIVKMATWCRKRSRFVHGTTRLFAGVATAGGAGAVATGAALVAFSGGAAAPAVAGTLLYAGFTASAVGAGVSLTNTLAALGLDQAQAQEVEKKINELHTRLERWDGLINAVLQAIADGKAGKTAEGPPAVVEMAQALAQYGAAGSALYSVASATFRASIARTDPWVMAAPAAFGGAVKAGTVAASSLTLTFSSVAIVSGFVESINGGRQIWSGYCEAADSLDAHADKFCALLRMMRAIAQDTPAQAELRGQLPWLVLIQIEKCKLPKPDYRVGDLTRRMIVKSRNLRPITSRVYFQFQMGFRVRNSDAALVHAVPRTMCQIGQAVLMRVYQKDNLQVEIQARDRRGLQSYIRGDPAMGAQLKLNLHWDEEQAVKLHSADNSTEIHASYQIIRGDGRLDTFRELRMPGSTQYR